jgi:hypothetical protein
VTTSKRAKRRDGRCHRKREDPKPLGRRKSRSGGAPALLPPRRRPPRDPESREPRANRGRRPGGVSPPDLRRKRPALLRGGARGGRRRHRTGAPSSSELESGDCGDLTATELYSVSVCVDAVVVAVCRNCVCKSGVHLREACQFLGSLSFALRVTDMPLSGRAGVTDRRRRRQLYCESATCRLQGMCVQAYVGKLTFFSGFVTQEFQNETTRRMHSDR